MPRGVRSTGQLGASGCQFRPAVGVTVVVDGDAAAGKAALMQSRACAATLVAAMLAAAAPTAARADEVDYFAAKPDSQNVTVKRQKSRTSTQRLQIGGAIAAGALFAGAGLYYHLDSRAAADSVSGNSELASDTWTAERQATYDQAGKSGYVAGFCYALSAAFFAGAAVIGWMTTPGEEELVIKPGNRTATPVVAPIPGGGAMVGGEWRW